MATLEDGDGFDGGSEKPMEISSLDALRKGLVFWRDRLNGNAGESSGQENLRQLRMFCSSAVAYFKGVLQRQQRSNERELLHAMGNVFCRLQTFVDEQQTSLEGVRGDIAAAYDLIERLRDPDEVTLHSVSWLEGALRPLADRERLGVDTNGVPTSLIVPQANRVLLALVNLINNALNCPGVTFASCVFDFREAAGVLDFEVSQIGADLPEIFDFERAIQESGVRGATGNGLRDVAALAREVGGSFKLMSREGAWFQLSVPVEVDAEQRVVDEQVSFRERALGA